jgi:hypothetical protein
MHANRNACNRTKVFTYLRRVGAARHRGSGGQGGAVNDIFRRIWLYSNHRPSERGYGKARIGFVAGGGRAARLTSKRGARLVPRGCALVASACV